MNASREETSAAAPTGSLPARGLRKGLLLAGAAVFFVLGVLGAILPGLPATPFLLLTSYLLTKTSPRLNARLLRSRLFGAILRDWQRERGIRRGVRRKAIVVVVAAVAATLYFSPLQTSWKWGIAALAGVGIWVVLRLPVLHEASHDRHAGNS